MKIKALIVVLSIVLSAFSLFITPSLKAEINFGFPRKFVLDVYKNGEITDEKMIVYLTVQMNSGRYYVNWKNILFKPMSGFKKVWVSPNSFSSNEGTIINIKIGEDWFSFDLKASDDTLIKVFGNKKNQMDYHLEGVYFFMDYYGKKVKQEWKSIDKTSISLPFSEVE